MPWVDACGAEDVEREDVIPWAFDGRNFAIYRSPADAYYCTAGLCTHEQVHLADGLVLDHTIECPKHNGRFDYTTGAALRTPACVDLATYPARREGDRVLVWIE